MVEYLWRYSFQEAFLNEVKILRRIQEEYKITKESQFLNLYEIFEGDSTYYLVVDLMAGKSLQHELNNLKVQK